MSTPKEHLEKKLNLKHEFEEAVGSDFDSFLGKLTFLKTKWAKQIALGDSVEGRLISPVLFHKATPLNYSIVSDRLDYFKKYFEEIKKELLSTTLMQACLCGSQLIAEFIAKELDMTPIHYLAYVCSSPNQAWAIALANKLSEQGKQLPSDIFLFCTELDTLTEIKKIFIEKSRPVIQ
jgi:hypothetical protein